MEQCWLLIISILMWGPSSINGATDPSDASALNAMYTGLGSPPQLTGWSASGNDPCGQNWLGVTCSGSRVTQIKVPGLTLSGASLGFQLDKLTQVTEFDVSNNNIAGSIPYQLPQNVQRLNLASNNFNGAVPYSISNMTSLTYLNISHNQLNQPLGDMYQVLSQLSTMDLSFNQISGPLPSTFSSLSKIDSLYLENNQFTGTIDVLASLPLQTLDIENNRFTGWIPQQLKGINLQTSGNSFSTGPAPPPPPGTPPAKTNHHKSGKSSSEESSGKGSGIGGGGIAGIVISLLVVGAIVAFVLVKRRSRKSARDLEKADNQPLAPLASNDAHEAKSIQSTPSVDTMAYEAAVPISLKPPPVLEQKSFDGNDSSNNFVSVPMPDPVITKKAKPVPSNVKVYSIADLQMATGSFSIDNLLGEGSIGRVYRAEFDDGKVLAVKKIDSTIISSYPEDFTEIVASISRFNHPNVTKLVGYCSEHGQHLLVYEYHNNGSLHDFLHLPDESNKPLTWNSRVKIALGSARALEYLHEACSPSVIHKNFKSENVLLDGEMSPHVSDCGLSSLVLDADQVINHNSCAPEVADSGEYSLKSDVYSFGVVMLELLTGRKPFDSSKSRSEQSLVRWATPQLHDIDALTSMVDPDLEGLYPVKSLSRFADVIALCIQPEPEFRPPMSEVVQSLVRLVQRANMSKRTVGTRQAEDDSVN